MNFAVVLSVLNFLLEHKDEIKTFIKYLEESDLVGALAGAEKAAAVRQFIATALGVENQIEAAWPMVAPFFNLVVAAVKKPKVA